MSFQKCFYFTFRQAKYEGSNICKPSSTLVTVFVYYSYPSVWYSNSVVLISISLMTNDVEHFLYAVDNVYIFFKEMSNQIICPFLDWVVCALLLKIKVFVFLISGYQPLSDTWFANILFHSMDCLFTYLMVSF